MTLLNLVNYDPTIVVAHNQAANDSAGHTIYLSDADVAALTNGGTLLLHCIYIYAKGSAVNTITQNEFATALQNGFDGIITLEQKNQNLVSADDCALAAAAALNLLAISRVDLSFQVRSPFDDWRPGQSIRFIDSVAGIDVLLDIQTVSIEFLYNDGMNDIVSYSVNAAPYPIDPDAQLISAINLSTRPPNPRGTLIG